MKKTLILLILLIFSFNTSVISEEKKCKAFDLVCKTSKMISDTKDFQKKGLKKSKDQVKGNVDTMVKKKKKIDQTLKEKLTPKK